MEEDKNHDEERRKEERERCNPIKVNVKKIMRNEVGFREGCSQFGVG